MKVTFLRSTIAWLIFALFITTVMVLVHPMSSQPFSVWDEFVWEFAFALVWIPATPFVLFLAAKYPVHKHLILKNGLLLFAVGFALATLQCLAHGLLVFLFNPELHELTANLLLRSLFYNIDKMLIIFGVLVVMQHAITYSKEAREKELKASRLEAQLSQAQIQALKMQLNPHFLFNTLNAVVTLIHKDPDIAEQMLVRLGDFLRLTLEHSGRQIVTLREELEFVQTYLEIEKIRFQDRLRIEFDIPSEILDVSVPNLILQPLVENAVKHGISQSSEEGLIVISADVVHRSLKLSVKDDGVVVDDTAQITEGIGLSNTRARLIRLYGDDASLLLHARNPRGIEAVISIPVQQEHQIM